MTVLLLYDARPIIKGYWYHNLSFEKNGKIIEGGDFGDLIVLEMAVMPEPNRFINFFIA